jgi:Phosphate-selective porin O and P
LYSRGVAIPPTPGASCGEPSDHLIMRRSIPVVVAVTSLVTSLVTAPASAQIFTFSSPDSSARLTLGGRVQTIFNTTSVEGHPTAQTELRRVRLEAVAQLTPLISGRVQPEFVGERVTLRDAFVRLDFDPALQVIAGQTHKPFGVITPTSDNRILPIEKGVRIRGVQDAFEEYNLVGLLGYAERDLGFQLRGEPRNAPLGLTYSAGVYNGPAMDQAPLESTWAATARVTARPVSGMRLGASWARIDHVLEETADETIQTREGQAWEADVELGSERGGLRVVGEAAYGDFDPFAGAHFFGAQGWLAYRTGRMSRSVSAVEPLLRVSYGDPDVEDDADVNPARGGTLITPGVNLWLGGLSRFALNVEVWDPEEGETVHSFKALFQIAF